MFGLESLFNYISILVGYVKPILMEEQLWYYLTDN